MGHTSGSDSLTAEVMEASGNHEAAAMLFARAFSREPSPGLLCRMWESVAAGAEHFEELPAGALAADISRWADGMEWSSEDLMSLLESSVMLGDSALSDSLILVLVEAWPGSEEAYEAVGWEFWDGLYPVWSDDSARIAFLEEFIREWGSLSDMWRCRARRYMLAAALETADSVMWETYLDRWLESCPGDPRARLSGAALHLERGEDPERALELAEEGLALFGETWYPGGMPQPEREITLPALLADLRFRRAWALLAVGDAEEALSEVLSVSAERLFDMDDHHTRAPYLWLEGEARLALGDTAGARDAWLESVVLGDERNRWADSSLAALGASLPLSVEAAAWGREQSGYAGPVFEDVTGMLGPDSLVGGSRVSWCDYDLDGWPDLLLGRDLYRNRSGQGFTNVSGSVFADSNRGNGGVWGDLDGDGVPDLVTSGNPVQVFLLREGMLVDVTDSLGISATGARVEGVGLLDWDADGWLDVYLASYEGGGLGEGTADAFYLGGPDGFREASDSLGMTPFLGEPRCGRGVSPCDWDRDGDMDIFVSNYRLQENFLWENVPGGASNSALELGVAGHESDGWWGHTIGSAWGDYDGDGDWDLFSANLAHPRYIGISDRSELLRRDADGFTDVRAESGIRFEETHSNPVWGDFDCDGLLDLFVTSTYEGRRSFLYRQLPEGGFEDVTFLSGARVWNGWGASAADFDRDGRLDLAVGSGSGPVLLRNVTGGGSWLLVEVDPPAGTNRSGIGCTVEVARDCTTLIRQVSGGSGTTSQDAPLLHFGLPGGEGLLELRLYVPGSEEPVWSAVGVWPDGAVTAGG